MTKETATTYFESSNWLDEGQLASTDIVINLLELRKDQDISQRQLADLTGIDQGQISRIEKFIVDPRLDTVARIADALGYDIELTKKEGNEL